MSRHEIPLVRPKAELWIGWDPGLDTFLQGKAATGISRGRPVIWLGAMPP